MLTLRPVRLGDEYQVILAHHAMAHESFSFALGWRPELPFEEYVQGAYREPDWVPFTLFVGVVDGYIVGRLALRHALTEDLLRLGGHIGYCVLPGYRGRGFATDMLRQVLPIAARLGMPAVLLTCDEDNVASQRVIEKCGGERTTDSSCARRYWIRTLAKE